MRVPKELLYVRLLRYTGGLMLLLSLALAACDDATGLRVDPVMTTDTISLAAPTTAITGTPTALDIVALNGVMGGGRHPERAADAGQWDFVVRVRTGDVVLLPSGALGLDARAQITRALEGRTFDELARAPERAAFLTDSAVVMREGSVYAARSRPFGGAFGSCFQYSKLQPLEVDVVAGTIRLQVSTNERCGDNRLVPR
ncbi:hypothetical protein BH23GEM7_BH23GEM7_04350 [soil metagenome]